MLNTQTTAAPDMSVSNGLSVANQHHQTVARHRPIGVTSRGRSVIDEGSYHPCAVCGAHRRVLLRALGMDLCHHCWEIHAATSSAVLEMRLMQAVQRDDVGAVKSLRSMLDWSQRADAARRGDGLIPGGDDGCED